MSAILAILLMISGTLMVFPIAQRVNATPTPIVTVTPGPNVVKIGPLTPGYKFQEYVDVQNVVGLLVSAVGFYFNATVLQVLNVTDGGFITNGVPSGNRVNFPGSIDNSAGIVYFYTWGALGAQYAKNGSGHLASVWFEVNPSFTGSYTGTYPGTPVWMANMTETNTNIQLYLSNINGDDITPSSQNIYNGTFTIAVPLPLSVSISPSSATLDLGQSQLFTSTVTGGTGPYTYQWYLNGVAISGATASTWTFTPSVSGSYNVYLNATDSIGTKGKSNTAPVTVHPTLSVSVSPAVAACYVGQSQQFISIVSGGSPPYSYQWYLDGSPVSGATSASWTFAPVSTGIYLIYVKTTDAVGITAQSNTAQLTVSPPPVVGVTISQSGFLIEVGQSVFFNSSVTGGNPPYSYQWYLNGTAVAGANNPKWTFIPSSAGTYNVYLNVTDALGTVGVSNLATLIVSPSPTVLVTPASVALDIGEPWTFTASTFGGFPPFSYQWYIDGSPVINATGDTWTYTPFVLADRTVYVTATDSLGIECMSNTVTVTVSNAMNPLVSPLSAIIDAGQSQMLAATVSGGTPPYSYQWYQWLPSGAVPFAGATDDTFTFMASLSSIGFDILYVEITDSLGVKVDCGATVIVNPPPAASISPASVVMDVGQSQQFASFAVNGTPPYTYQWFIDDAPIAGATNSIWIYTPTTPQSVGAHTVSLVVTDSVNLAEHSSNNATVTVNPLPTILVSPASVALDIGEPWTFIASTSGGTPPFSAYQWYIDGIPVIGATNYTWTYTPLVLADRNVYATATDSVGFHCTSNVVLVTVSSALNPKISPVSATLDLGQSQQYTVSVSGGTPPYSYQWYQWLPSGAVPFAGATSNTFEFTPVSIGLNIIYVEVRDSLGVKVDWGAATVVNPPLAVLVSPNSVVLDIGQSQLFTSAVVNGTPPYSYQWYLDSAPITGATSSSWTYTATLPDVGTHTVTLRVTDATNSIVSANSTVIVNPPLETSISSTFTEIDLGLSVSLTSTTSGGMMPYSFQWYVNGVLASSTGATLTITPGSAGTYAIVLNVTDALGSMVTSNTVTVTVNPDPTVAISPAIAIIPLGQNQTFTALITGGTPQYLYQWYVDGVLAVQTTVPTFMFTPTTITKYYMLYVTIIDTFGFNATSNTAIINGHDIATVAVVPIDSASQGASKTVFGKGLPMAANVTLTNVGYFPETFTVTLYVNATASSTVTAIASKNVTLIGGQTTTVRLAGTTTNLAYGHYTLIAYALPVYGEVNDTNNRLTNKTTPVIITIPGDLNGDGYVNPVDLGMIAAGWRKQVPPAPGNADVNGDGAVNVADLAYVTAHWGQHVTIP